MQRRDRCVRPVLAAVAIVAGCGGSNPGTGSDGGSDGAPDTPAPIDAPTDSMIELDAPPPPIDAPPEPPPPTLGAQLHRAGRPGVRTLLLGTLASSSVQTALRDAYDRAADPAAWRTLALPNGVTVERELATNMAVWDGLDKGASITGAGCGNTFKYAAPGPGSYLFPAGLLADDQLYVDTQRTSCDIYFDLELNRAASFAATTCGGRTPGHDAIDMMYSVLAAGAFGVEVIGRVPKLGDGVAPHADVTTTFPFLGPPH